MGNALPSPTAAQAVAVLAVGAAAAAFVAGLGTYLYIRFTQHGRKAGGVAEPPQPPPPGETGAAR